MAVLAGAGEANASPLYYPSVVPLMSSAHRDVSLVDAADFRFAATSNGIPVTIDEISVAQAHYPIVFANGREAMPFVLVGAPGEGNRFVDANGAWQVNSYVPAYVRRYPFLLAKLEPSNSQLTLCFDADAACIVQQAGGGNLFNGAEPSPKTSAVLRFCEQFEGAAQKTKAAVAELVRLGLLIDGEASVQRGNGSPSVFRGFQIVLEEKLHRLPEKDLAALVKTGAMALIYAHLFSLRHLAQFAQPEATPQVKEESVQAA